METRKGATLLSPCFTIKYPQNIAKKLLPNFSFRIFCLYKDTSPTSICETWLLDPKSSIPASQQCPKKVLTPPRDRDPNAESAAIDLQATVLFSIHIHIQRHRPAVTNRLYILSHEHLVSILYNIALGLCSDIAPTSVFFEYQ